MPGAFLDGKIYVAGGIDPNISVLSSMEVYDVESETWSNAADMPTPRHHHASAVSNGKLYIMGGYSTILFNATDEVYEYNPQSNQWTEKSPLPLAIGAGVAVESAGYIYFIGGTTGTNVLNINLRYNPATDNWDTLKSMPTPREHHAAAVIDSLIYVVGGRGNDSADTKLEAYSPASDRWYVLKNMPTGRSGLNASALNGKLYVMGGEGGGIHEEMEEYNPADDTWRPLHPMITPRHGIAAITTHNEIYVIGGAYQEGFGPSDANESFSFPAAAAMESRNHLTFTLRCIHHTLEMNIPSLRNETVVLRLYDLNGKIVQQTEIMSSSTGSLTINLDIIGSSKLLICELRIGDLSAYKKVLLFE